MVRRAAGRIHFLFLRACRLRAQDSQRFRHARGEHGSALVEMALSLFILLTVVLGLMEISMALFTFHFISEAAREGSRYAMVRGSSCPAILSGCPAAGTSVDVQTYLRGLGFPVITPSLLKVTTTFPTTGTSCTPSTSPCDNPGNLVNVVVTYKFPLSIPFIPARMLNMTSTSQMVISQ
jgi:Flp pilus assembly protein TadG